MLWICDPKFGILEMMLKFPDPTWFDEVESTNLTAKKMIMNGKMVSNSIIAARTQTAGKGRKSRSWISQAGENLTFSIVIFFDKIPQHLSTLTLATGVAVSIALEQHISHCQLKWPNDIYISNKKICGILTENIPLKNGCAVIVGIGININLPAKAASKINQPATSLQIETSQNYPIENILSQVTKSFEETIEIWINRGFEPLAKLWNNRNLHKDKLISIKQINGNVISGLFTRIGSQGQLILRTDNAAEIEIWEGDITVSAHS